MKNQISLEDVWSRIDEVQGLDNKNPKGWTPYKIFVHCGKTIEYSMTGYPKMKPALIRGTVGKIVFRKFMKQGYMNHNLQADVPGSPLIGEEGTGKEGEEILRKAIDQFLSFEGTLQPHLIFGRLSKEEYSSYFAMHIMDHLTELEEGRQ